MYLAIVEGRPEPDQGKVADILTETTALHVFHNDHQTPGSRLAITHYRVLQTRGDYSLVRVRAGRAANIRFASTWPDSGCLVAGDRRYGSKVDPCRRLACTRPCSRWAVSAGGPVAAVALAAARRAGRTVAGAPQSGRAPRLRAVSRRG